jgi:hypothetical protein
MRSNSGKLLTALVAVLALSAVAATSASAALPEFSANTVFTGTIGATKFKWFGEEWNYKTGTDKGKITGSTVSEVGLRLNTGPNGCNTKGEELVLTALKGRFGYLNKAKEEVGLLLGETSTEPLAECAFRGGIAEEYEGEFIAKITPVNTKTTHFQLRLAQISEKQEFTKFEGEETKSHVLLLGGRAAILEVAEFDLTTAVAVELKA